MVRASMLIIWRSSPFILNQTCRPTATNRRKNRTARAVVIETTGRVSADRHDLWCADALSGYHRRPPQSRLWP